MKPGEHKTVQARILEYAEAIGWTIVPREEAEQRRGFDPEASPADRARNRSLFFDDLLDARVREVQESFEDRERSTAEALDELLVLDEPLRRYVIVHELLHFSVPNHGKLWKSLMTAHLGDYHKIERKLDQAGKRQQVI